MRVCVQNVFVSPCVHMHGVPGYRYVCCVCACTCVSAYVLKGKHERVWTRGGLRMPHLFWGFHFCLNFVTLHMFFSL